MLLNFLDTGLYERQGKATTNFAITLPEEESDLAQEITKDPYNFDFLTLTERYNEKEMKDALLDNAEKFFLELGKGFSYVGRFRPYIAFGSPFLAVFSIMTFINMGNGTGGVILSAVIYIIAGMLYTLVNIPYSSLAAVMTEDPERQNKSFKKKQQVQKMHPASEVHFA